MLVRPMELKSYLGQPRPTGEQCPHCGGDLLQVTAWVAPRYFSLVQAGAIKRQGLVFCGSCGRSTQPK